MIPQSEIELEEWMQKNCFNFNSYSINGNAIFEGYGIDKINGQFIWYYIERGEKENIKYFDTEKKLIEYAFNEIKFDKWAKTHCIGMTTMMEEKIKLSNELNALGIDFIQDKIPYYGPDRPAYRTFVIGCDWMKVVDLKKKYFKEL